MKPKLVVLFTFSLVLSIEAQEKCNGPNEFLCHSGGCISKVFLCDGSRECFDGSDETHDLCQFRGCSESIDYEVRDKDDIFAIPSLGTGQNFRCGYGACIALQFTCDGIQHCVADGSDETAELCKDFVCRRREFKCDYGGCIARRNACDNRQHCADGSDETDRACKWRRKTCLGSRQFQCKFGACIQLRKKCDHTPDCLDGSDETEETCGPGHNVPTSTLPPIVTSLPSFTPPPIQTVRPILSFPKTEELVTFPPPTPEKTSDSPVPTGNGAGCQQTDNLDINLEILTCGDNSHCIDDIVPSGSFLVFHCPGGSLALRCRDDNKWHFEREPDKPPRVQPCKEEQSLVETTEVKRHFIRPTTCGNVPKNQHLPWLVGLFRDQEFSCTGTVIGPALILTAGHCIVRTQSSTGKEVIRPDILKIQFNSERPNDPKTFATVASIELHPLYTGGSNPRYDVALLFLNENLEASHKTSSACLDQEGKLLRVSAWTFDRTFGQLSYRWNNVEKVLDPSCFNRATECSRHLNIGENQFCGMNKEPSMARLHQGSSGGPYFIVKSVDGAEKWFTAGVVSHSFDTSECGTNSVFTSVSKLHPWIVNCGFEGKCSA